MQEVTVVEMTAKNVGVLSGSALGRSFPFYDPVLAYVFCAVLDNRVGVGEKPSGNHRQGGNRK